MAHGQQMLQITPSCRQHWRISICPTAAPRIIWRTRNSCHVSIASGDTLLHVGVWCKLRPRRGFIKVSEELKITGPHTAKRPCDWLQCYVWEIMDHAAYSPDLAPSAFHYFGPLTTEMAGKRFATDTEVKQVVTSWLQTLGTDLWYVGKQALVYEVTNAPMLTMTIWRSERVPCIHQSFREQNVC